MSEFVCLGEYAKIQKGRTPLIIGYSGPDAIPYLNPDYLRGRSTAEPAKSGSDSVITTDGESVLLWDGSNAGEFFQARRGIVASTMARITPSAGLEPKYFFHALKHAEPLLKAQTNGTGIPHVDREVLEKIRIFKPDGEVQKSIACILDTLDAAIRETEAIIAKLKAVKQGLLHDLLTRGIDANGELRPPRADAPHLYKQSPLGWIPKEWTYGVLQAWLNSKPKNGYSPQEAGNWTGVQMLGLGCLTTEGFRPSQLKAAPSGDGRLAAAMLADGDLLISRANTRDLVGLAGIYRNVGTPCTYPDLMMRLQPSNETTGEFLELVLRSPVVSRQIKAQAVGTSESMVKISGRIVSGLKVALPQRPEQDSILSRIFSIVSRQVFEERRLLVSREIKTGLMDDLLTGRVRVTPLLSVEQQEQTRSA